LVQVFDRADCVTILPNGKPVAPAMLGAHGEDHGTPPAYIAAGRAF
jgi:hypothetical protein